MRIPTPHAEAYNWHREAMAGLDPEVGQEPQCGWFKRRLVKNGPFVPARIWLDADVDEAGELISDERFQCEVNGQWADAENQWQWLCGEPITEQEFYFLTASIAWTEAHAPHEPMANVRQPIDWSRVPIPTFT